MPETFFIKDDLVMYRLDLKEARKNSHIKEKRFVESKVLRNLVYHVFGTQTEITHNQYGKPLLVGREGCISVSHSKEWLVLLYSPSRRVGVDTEPVQERLIYMQEKYLDADEMKDFRNHALMLTVAWCAKESVLKCIGFKNISFRRDLKIIAVDKDKAQLIIRSNWAEKQGVFVVQWIEADHHIIAMAYESRD